MSSCCFHVNRRQILVDRCSHGGVTGGIGMETIFLQNRQKFKIFRKISKIRKCRTSKSSQNSDLASNFTPGKLTCHNVPLRIRNPLTKTT
uniref:Uncharacterized protein n=1 Tax=Romanomermis culicivorax TaxID=13658 RepID=A0A915K3F0_ROMCU